MTMKQEPTSSRFIPQEAQTTGSDHFSNEENFSVENHGESPKGK